MRDTVLTARLRDAGLDARRVRQAVQQALNEDLRYGPDATSIATVEASADMTAAITSRQHGTIAGVPVACAVLEATGADFSIDLERADAATARPGDVVMRIRGPARQLLLAERTMLNFACHLSGVATATRAWVDAVAGTTTQIRDTRKTLPGLRDLQKYAVRCGGGQNHRLGLGDAILIKDNHIAAAGGISAAIEAARVRAPGLPLEVECDTVAQVESALATEPDIILLDNMSVDDMTRSVELTRKHRARTKLEASGGITLDQARKIAKAGVDFIAIGALTHSVTALDLGLDFVR